MGVKGRKICYLNFQKGLLKYLERTNLKEIQFFCSRYVKGLPVKKDM